MNFKKLLEPKETVIAERSGIYYTENRHSIVKKFRVENGTRVPVGHKTDNYIFSATNTPAGHNRIAEYKSALKSILGPEVKVRIDCRRRNPKMVMPREGGHHKYPSQQDTLYYDVYVYC